MTTSRVVMDTDNNNAFDNSSSSVDFIDTLNVDIKNYLKEADDILQSFHEIENPNNNATYSSLYSDEEEDSENHSNDNDDEDDDDEDDDDNSIVHCHEMADELEKINDGNSISTSIIQELRDDLNTNVLFIPRWIQKQESNHRPLIAVLDRSSSLTMIHKRALPRGATPKIVPGKPKINKTLLGTFTSKRQVWLQDIIVPQIMTDPKNQSIHLQEAYVFDDDDATNTNTNMTMANGLCCDIIVGRDFLKSLRKRQKQYEKTTTKQKT